MTARRFRDRYWDGRGKIRSGFKLQGEVNEVTQLRNGCWSYWSLETERIPVEVRPEVEVFTDHEGKSRMPLTTVKCSLKSAGREQMRDAGTLVDSTRVTDFS